LETSKLARSAAATKLIEALSQSAAQRVEADHLRQRSNELQDATQNFRLK
jgi:hypothetical protein